MALFSRIFQNRKSNKTSSTKWYTSEPSKKWSQPEFNGSQVRLVLYRDQDFKGRSLLFDSNAVHRAPEQNDKKDKRFEKNAINLSNSSSGSTEEAGGTCPPLPKYTFSRPGSDTKMLEEMAFGAVGMAFRGSTLKVHTIRSPPQLMVTKVFVPSRGRARESGVETESLDYTLNCSSTELAMPQKIAPTPSQANPSIAQSVPMDVPSSPQQRSYDDLEPEDSGFSTSGASSLSSLTASIPRSSSSSSINSNSYNSMTRRWRRNQQTSLEHSLLKRQSDEGVYEQPVPATKRPAKVGMAVVISLDEENEETARMFQNFFFSHVTLIEGHVNKLKMGVERAMCNRKIFVHLMVEALEVFRQLLVDLYLTPRLPEPVWLNMMCYTTHRVALCQRFLREFMTAVTKYDTKQTHFFLSTLITGVLTNHLAWVPTVTPAGATPSRSYLDKHSAKWLDAVAKSHPYNPLWAQLGDLYGALGFPLRLSRTVVVGKKADLVNKFLYILSYFIRCSEVLERSQLPYDFDECEMDPDMAGDSISLCSGRCSCGTLSPPPQGAGAASVSCAQCQANRAGTPDGGVRPGPRPESPAVFARPGYASPPTLQTDGTRTRLKHSANGGGMTSGQGEEVVTEGEDPGGGFRPLVRVPLVRACYSPVVVKPNMLCLVNSTETAQTDTASGPHQDLPNSATADQFNFEAVGQQQSEDEEEVSTETKTNTDRPTVCRMSPTYVKEEPETVRIRHVGRQASAQPTSPPLSPLRHPSHDARKNLPASAATCDTTPLPTTDCARLAAQDTCDNKHIDDEEDEARSITTKTEFCHDSGMFDTVLPPGHGRTAPSPPLERDSGVSVSDTDLHPELTAAGPGQPTEPGSEVASKYRAPPTFEHSHSMFDEYFTEETSAAAAAAAAGDALSRNQPRQTKTAGDRFKRMASIEGSSSLFDEYMSVPCPDISRISETSRVSLGAVDTEDTSIFDEYFSIDSTRSAESENAADGNGEAQSSRVHLADRRKATRPDCLVVNVGNKDGDHTPRAALLSGQSTATLTPARTRSVTPTELSRRRHASSLSNASSIEADFFLSLKEVDMPTCEQPDDACTGSQSFQRNFGRSLLAGCSPHYLSDFVLHGTSDTNFQAALHSDLTMSVQDSVLDEQISEAVCVVADVDNWTVKLQKCHYDTVDRVKTQDVAASPLVCNIIESVNSLWKLKMSPEFCLMHLEDRLQEIFFKSRTLAEYLRLHKRIDIKQLATMLKFDVNDIPLLMAVAGTHTPIMSMALL